jgi:hypothetical protein
VPNRSELGEEVYIVSLQIQLLGLVQLSNLSKRPACRACCRLAGATPGAAGPQTGQVDICRTWHRAGAGRASGLTVHALWWSMAHSPVFVERSSAGAGAVGLGGGPAGKKQDAGTDREVLNPWNAPDVHWC